MEYALLPHQQSNRSLLPIQHAHKPSSRSNLLIHKEKEGGTPFAYIHCPAN